MTRRKANALNPRRADGVENVSKARLPVQITPVRVHVLAKQGDFFDTGQYIPARFVRNILEWPRFLASAHVRNNAVRAEVIAPDGDRQPSSPLMLSVDRKACRKVERFVQDLNVMPALFKSFLHQAWKRGKIMSAEHDVKMWQLFRELFSVTLPDTTADGYHAF